MLPQQASGRQPTAFAGRQWSTIFIGAQSVVIVVLLLQLSNVYNSSTMCPVPTSGHQPGAGALQAAALLSDTNSEGLLACPPCDVEPPTCPSLDNITALLLNFTQSEENVTCAQLQNLISEPSTETCEACAAACAPDAVAAAGGPGPAWCPTLAAHDPNGVGPQQLVEGTDNVTVPSCNVTELTHPAPGIAIDVNDTAKYTTDLKVPMQFVGNASGLQYLNSVSGRDVLYNSSTGEFVLKPLKTRRWNEKNARIAMILTSYNMPERTNKVVEHVRKHVKWPVDIIVVDNGSNQERPSNYTSVFLAENVQTTHGWLAGLAHADALAAKYNRPYFAYWVWITSTEIPENQGDVLTPMVKFMLKREDAVQVHPALTRQSTTNWYHMKKQVHNKAPVIRKVDMIDNLAALIRADWFDSIGRFDKQQTMAWGVDIETSFIARCMNKTVWIDERVLVQKITGIAYNMNRMGMTNRDRNSIASRQLTWVWGHKYPVGRRFISQACMQNYTKELIEPPYLEAE